MSSYRVVVFKGWGVAAPYVMQDLAEAFRDLGHEVLLLDVANLNEKAAGALVPAVGEFKPDFAVFYGAVGIIRYNAGPRVTHILQELDLPFAALIYDNPHLIMDVLKWARSPLMNLFVWDDVYADELRAAGFERVNPIALATNPRRFAGNLRQGHKGRDWQPPAIAFVGSLPGEDRITQLRDELQADTLVHAILRIRRLNPALSAYQAVKLLSRELDARTGERLVGLLDTPFSRKLAYLTDVMLMRERRIAAVRALEGHGINVWGSENWREVLKNPDTYKGRIDYDNEVPVLYATASIVLDVPAGQLLTSVNQRVFDVLAAGGFIITEYRRDIEKHFRIGEEIVCYRDVNELVGLVEKFLHDPNGRAKITAAGQRRVLSQHTWHRRAEQIAEVMGAEVKSRRARVHYVLKSYMRPVACNVCGSEASEPLYEYKYHYCYLELRFRLVRCKNCHLVFNNPQWESWLVDDFYRQRYHRRGESEKDLGSVVTALIPVAEQELDLIEELKPPGRLLDVGAGICVFGAVAATRGWEVWALEPFEEPVKWARELFPWANMHILPGKLDGIVLPEGSFDVITLNEVLEHVHNPSVTLARVHSLLRADGYVVITVPDALSIHARLNGREWRHWDPPYHLYGFSRHSLTVLLDKTGFQPLLWRSSIMYPGQLLVVGMKTCFAANASLR